MKFIRRGSRTTVEFTSPGSRSWRAQKLSDHLSDSLFQPMLQPLSTNEYALRADSDLQGTWKGTIRPWYWPFISQRGTLNIAEQTPGNFVGELNVSPWGGDKLPVAVIYHPSGVEFALKSGEAFFKGKLNADRTRIKGQFIQGNRSIGVTLYRSAPRPNIPSTTATNTLSTTK